MSRFPFNSGRIISESKHVKDAVKIYCDELTSELLSLLSSQVDRSQCVCVLGELSAPLDCISNPFPFMADKVIYPTCH